MNNPLFRSIPSVNELLETQPLRNLVDRANRTVVVRGVRTFLDKLREDVKQAAQQWPVPSPADLAEKIADWIHHHERPTLRPVINATGVLLHTGLGRAPLAREAIEAVEQIAEGYCSLEIDLETGERSQRVRAVERQLERLTGAEAAVVVNNNAAATLLALTALAAGREVVISRGHLIEIGGAFRLPEVMTASGAKLREVGTTNRTRIDDFARAIEPQTGALLKVHPSNYVISGFTCEPTIQELVALGRERGVPVIDDIGSGALIDFRQFGLQGEPVARDSVAAGADVVLFSGDKLLGGPQCGVIVGRREPLERIARHPLMRALRVDKLTLAALAATLSLYDDETRAMQAVPLLALLGAPLENLKNRAERLAPQLAALPAVGSAEPVAGETFLGGGAVPTQAVPTWSVALTPASGGVDALAAALRTGTPAVFGRIHDGRLLFDLRSVAPSQDLELVKAVEQLGAAAAPEASESIDAL